MAAGNIFQYCVKQDGDAWFDLDVGNLDDEFAETIAADAGEDYWDNHDGWENNWPLTISLKNPQDVEIGDFVVEMESVPQFYASKCQPT